MNIPITYEDDNLLVLNKPAGLIVHPKNASDAQPSVCDWIDANYSALHNVGEPFNASGASLPRRGIVHRLDKDTSGLLIIAKTQPAFDYLKKQFQERTIRKRYFALVYGRPKQGSGTIDAPLGRVGLKRTTKIEGNKLIDSKPAVTEYATVKNFDNFTLLDVRPKTGRTHQIRVHLKSIGCPIVGDPVYGPTGRPLPGRLDRLFLHAYQLSFTAPDGKSLVIECDLPPELQEVLDHLQKTAPSVIIAKS